MMNIEDKPLCIAMLVYQLPPFSCGGSEKQAILLSKHLKQKGINPFFITGGNRFLRGRSTIDSVEVYRLFNFLNSFAGIFFKLSKLFYNKNDHNTQIEFNDKGKRNDIIDLRVGLNDFLTFLVFFINSVIFVLTKKRKIDIIHVHMMEWQALTGVLLGKVFRKPVLIKDSTMNGIENILRYPFGRRVQKFIIENAYFIAISAEIEKHFLKNGIKASHIFRIPNGIENPIYIKQEYNPCKTFIFVGNLYQQPAKGIDILFEAWQIVMQECKDLVLKVVGDGDLEVYRAYVKKNNIDRSIIFYGKTNNVGQLLLEADVFVLPSRREGLSNALLEAMAIGLPCIATNISGNQDLIVNYETGLLVESCNVKQLASAILYATTHSEDMKTFAKKGQKLIHDHYDIHLITSKIINSYNVVLCSK